MSEGGTPKPKIPTTPVDVRGPGEVWEQYFGDAGEMRFMINDIRERHLAALLQDGDDYYWLKRKLTGVVCPYWSEQAQNCQKPLDPISTCYNTKYLGGYDTPLLIKAALPTSEIQSMRSESGIAKMQPMRPWTAWEPQLSDRDMLVNRITGARLEVLNVQLSGPWRGLIVCQFFDVRLMQLDVDFAYKVPVPLIEES